MGFGCDFDRFLNTSLFVVLVHIRGAQAVLSSPHLPTLLKQQTIVCPIIPEVLAIIEHTTYIYPWYIRLGVSNRISNNRRRQKSENCKNKISKLRRWPPSWENDCILAPDPFIQKIRTLYSLQLLKLKEIKWSYFFNLKLRGRVIINLKKALRLQNIVLTNLSYCSLKWRHIYRRHPGTV